MSNNYKPDLYRVALEDLKQLEQDNLRPLIEAARTYLRAGAAIAEGEKYITFIRVGTNAVRLTIEAPSAPNGPIAFELLVDHSLIEGETPQEEHDFRKVSYLLAGAFHMTSELITVFMMRKRFDYEEVVARLELHQYAQGLNFIGLAVTNMTFDGLIDPPQAESSFSGAKVLNLVQRYV